MILNRLVAVAAIMIASLAHAAAPVDLAAAFGARESVREPSLSPDGKQIAFIAPMEGQGSGLYVVATDGTEAPRRVAIASGAPERLSGCAWISSERLVCRLFGVRKNAGSTGGFNRLIVIPTHAGPQGILKSSVMIGPASLARSAQKDGSALLISSVWGSSSPHVVIEQIDPVTGSRRKIETFNDNSIDTTADAEGYVRIVGYRLLRGGTGLERGTVIYRVRDPGASTWREFGRFDSQTREGFAPFSVDGKHNLAWGFRKQNGRLAVFTKTLDAAATETLVFAHPDVDVDGLVRIGPDERVIGVRYTTDHRHIEYLDPALKALSVSLAKAIPHLPVIDIVDASADEQKLLLRASSDVDPGRYYLLDRATKQLRILIQSRPELDGVPLLPMKTISFAARDGQLIPAYLTLPAGGSRNLPAIVLPHGGPSARDEWGFDWLAQYYAAKGYAVLQPNFRGSAGYGDAFMPLEGFRSWRTAIGDITDGARWLVGQGVADPARLSILGWSFGGYAALQAAATEPTLFKSVVAIAPVTDLRKMLNEVVGYSDYYLMQQFLGSGPALEDGSPAVHADRILAPVMLVHGKFDMNVSFAQSERMADQLRRANHPAKFITYDTLDHQLDDAAARKQVLEESEKFIRAAVQPAGPN